MDKNVSILIGALIVAIVIVGGTLIFLPGEGPEQVTGHATKVRSTEKPTMEKWKSIYCGPN